MVGAEPEDFKAIEPVLKAFCENIFHVARPATAMCSNWSTT